MLRDEESNSMQSSDQKNSKVASKGMNGIRKIKSLDIDTSAGFVCDINTGICGPIEKKKEGK
ncbi:hypothetical protein [Paucisalibacillus globulus]|uniref:hypothetical protein n=1 Tax=Paucisalibacillus globulus TaxID=351095 RepID=UPI000BB85BA8|nr:hypothetical protein [Paucisalibacillus globulus]